MKQTYMCIDDPGHGWMKVTIDEIRRLGIENKITSYSYRNGDDVYLEEDRDMSTFLDAKRALGEEYELTSRYEENTPIRGYPSYQSEHNDQSCSAQVFKVERFRL